MAKIRANDHYVPERRRPAVAGHVRQQDQGADVHGVPVDRRADRAVTARPWPRTSPARAASGSRSPTAPTSTRSRRRPSTAGTTSCSSTWPSEAPIVNSALIHAAAPVIYQEAMGITGVTLPPDPIQLQPTYATALAAFERLPSIRVLFDNGAGGLQPGHPDPGFERSWPSWPIPGTTARSWYLSPGGALGDAPPAQAGADSFTWNAHARPLTNFTGDTAAGTGGLWTATPPYQWTQNPAGSAVSYVTSAAQREHHRRRRRGGEGLGALLDPERGPPGDDQRGQARRQGDLRAGRLAARQRAQARRGQEHSARARPEPEGGRRVAAAVRPATSRPRSRSTTRGTSTARGRASGSPIAAPNGDQPIWSFGETEPSGTGDGLDRPLEADALEAAAAGGAG